MKKLIILLTVLCALGGCKKDNSDTSSQNQLLGRWGLEYYVDSDGERWNIPQNDIMYIEFNNDSIMVYDTLMCKYFICDDMIKITTKIDDFTFINYAKFHIQETSLYIEDLQNKPLLPLLIMGHEACYTKNLE